MQRAVTASPSDRVRFGFGGRFRLGAAAEFSAVFACRRVLRGQRFDLHYLAGDGASARIGLVIAKRFARDAVLRNRIKRIARESFRMARPGLPACDIILRLAKPVTVGGAAAGRSWRAEIDELLGRLAAALAR